MSDKSEPVVRINVVKRFIFTDDDMTQKEFLPGTHEVTQRIADHWMVNAHTDKAVTNKPAFGTSEYRDAMIKVQAARKAALEEADELVREANNALAANRPQVTNFDEEAEERAKAEAAAAANGGKPSRPRIVTPVA